jgi:hypothetical protein
LGEPNEQALAAAELIRSKDLTKQHPEESKKSHLTMAAASAAEWTIIEKAVRTVLPSKNSKAKASKTTASRERTANK